jgi:hypothetical protein
MKVRRGKREEGEGEESGGAGNRANVQGNPIGSQQASKET